MKSLNVKNTFFQKILAEKNRTIKKMPQVIYLQHFNPQKAEAGGFEPPVRFPVRRFSKPVVSATHPHFLKKRLFFCAANVSVFFRLFKSFSFNCIFFVELFSIVCKNQKKLYLCIDTQKLLDDFFF